MEREDRAQYSPFEERRIEDFDELVSIVAVPCRDGWSCKDRTDLHRKRYSHPCRDWEHCVDFSAAHRARYYHPCMKKHPLGDVERTKSHMCQYVHSHIEGDKSLCGGFVMEECPKGFDCEQLERYIRLLQEDKKPGAALLEHLRSFSHPCLYKANCPFRKDTAHSNLVYHVEMKPHVREWYYAPSHKVRHIPTGTVGTFIGYVYHEGGRHDYSYSCAVRNETNGAIFEAARTTDLESVEEQLRQPWDNENVVCLYDRKVKAIFDKAMQITGKTREGLRVTVGDVIQGMFEAGVPVFVIGGYVRDAVLGKTGNDMDCSFGGPIGFVLESIRRIPGLEKYAKNVGIGKVVLDVRGLDADVFEGKSMKGICYKGEEIAATDLYNDAISKDFSCNALNYDPINHVVVDPCGGKGIKDARKKVLSIPAPPSRWGEWLSARDSRWSKAIRLLDFLSRGYKMDKKEVDWIVAEVRKKTPATIRGIVSGYLGTFRTTNAGKLPRIRHKCVELFDERTSSTLFG